MLKTFYLLAWILVALSAGVSLSGGYFDSVTQVAISITVLALVYALALWSVFMHTRDARSQQYINAMGLNSNGGKQ